MLALIGIIGVLLSIAAKVICVQIGCASGVDDKHD
jgi:hypothetical protein